MSAIEIVDYDQIAMNYNSRYQGTSYKGVLKALRTILSDGLPKRVLEVGCGTCHWLKGLPTAKHWSLWGIDRSFEMLKQTNPSDHLLLIQGTAENLPYSDYSFDMVYCVNALHHFSEPVKFINEVFRVLQKGGVIGIVRSDPHDIRNKWYIYEFFENVLAKDLDRFPAWKTVQHWLRHAGFTGLNCIDVELIHAPKTSVTILQDPFLQKNGCSQMALLSNEDYQRGLTKVKLAANGDREKELIFSTEIVLSMQVAKKT